MLSKQSASVPADSGENDTTSLASKSLSTLESRTRRWGRGRLETKTVTISNRFVQIAPVWFYGLIGNFMECKDNSTLWGGNIGASLLARLFNTLSTIVECCGIHPGSDIMAKDLFEMVWLFREAEIPDVRMSVLTSTATCIRLLRDETLLQLLLDQSASVSRALQLIAATDSNSTCRKIAQVISASLDSSLKSVRPIITASD